MALCKAVVVSEFGGPEVLTVGTKPVPTPGDGEVLVNIKASGVNPSDTYVRLGPKGPWAVTPHLIPPLPFTPGKDGAGVVAAIGPGVSGLQQGDRVYVFGPNSGTMAEYCLCKAAVVCPLPAGLSFAEGACIGVPAATAYRALLQRGEAKAGDAVLTGIASGFTCEKGFDSLVGSIRRQPRGIKWPILVHPRS